MNLILPVLYVIALYFESINQSTTLLRLNCYTKVLSLPVLLFLLFSFYAKTRYMIGQKLKIYEWIIYSIIIAFATIVTVCST